MGVSKWAVTGFQSRSIENSARRYRHYAVRLVYTASAGDDQFSPGEAKIMLEYWFDKVLKVPGVEIVLERDA
jgi:hypothetical protein